MIVEVLFYNPDVNAYCGKSYTYYCNIQVKEMTKVLAPVQDGDAISLKKALVVRTNVSEETLNPEWNIKTIKELDTL